MRVLLDTHVLLGIADPPSVKLPNWMRVLTADPAIENYVSVASLWETAIKHRSGKLELPCVLEDWPLLLDTLGIGLLPVQAEHVLASPDPTPETKDPFDRILLAIADVETMPLLTIDTKLLDHPLAWRP